MLTCILGLLLSCQKPNEPVQNPTPNPTPNPTNPTSSTWLDSANIAIVGNENGYIYYWKNGYKYSLGPLMLGESYANDVAISGNDVYVAGRLGYKAKIWKNGVATDLTDGVYPAAAKAISVVGNDVYVAGFEYYFAEVVLWKNGVKSVVAKGLPGTYDDLDFVVSGSNIYMCGALGYSAYVWKNGVQTKLSDSSSYAHGIAVNGTDVYVVGAENDKAVYWKNGIKTILSNEPSAAYDIAISGSDVYIVGHENWRNAVYWKNGKMNILETGYYYSATANAIKILDKDVYIVGSIGGGLSTDICWKNGVRHHVGYSPTDSTATGSAYGIDVTKR